MSKQLSHRVFGWPQALGLAAVAVGAVVWPLVSHSDTRPTAGTVNLETAHVHPLDVASDAKRLLVANTAAHTVEVYDTTDARNPRHLAAIPVGLEPVSVRMRGTGEAWVVNQLSDSISIIDMYGLSLVRTLKTSNEPADVVFAGNRAFVSCADANVVEVFDLGNLAAAPQRVAIAGEEPRAMAVSPDGTKVYAAIFESGNGTTVLNGRNGDSINVVSRTEGPYKGQNPPPNAGSTFNPPLANAANAVPVSLIVRKSSTGTWMDDNQRDWSNFVSGGLASASGRVAGWNLADNDVAVIDTGSLAVSYQQRLMNINMAMAIHPPSGMVTVVGTDALNEVRYEPNLRSRFIKVMVTGFYPGGTPVFADLNPHLDYRTPTVAPALKAQSIGDPRGMAWRQDGSQAFITGMGSNNVVVIDSSGNRVGQIAVGQGPTGIALNDAAGVGYVVNKFSGSVSVLDLNSRQVLKTLAYLDPTPAVVKAGRPFLYDTMLGSGTGHTSCASCHVDGKTDRLAWDLGDPRGSFSQVRDADNNTGAFTGKTVGVTPMKGPMLTQTLQDIGRHGVLHWRGDKADLASFSGTFVNLQGLESAPTLADMGKLKAFLDTLHLPPNPYRALNNTRPNTVTLPAADSRTVTSASMNALRGTNSRNNNCLQCHLRSGSRNDAANLELGQSFIAPSLAGFYKRLGYLPKNAGGSLVGTGFFHDGSDSVDRAARTNTAESQNDMLAELMSLEGPEGPLTGNEKRQDMHAGVGRQVTLMGSLPMADSALLDQLVSIAKGNAHVALVAKAMVGVATRGVVMRADGSFQADRLHEVISLQGLKDYAAGGLPITFTLVAKGTEYRLGLDRDQDGILDTEEVDRGLNPADAATPVTRTSCGAEGGQCVVGGKAVVRFGAGTQWAYAVQEGTVSCSVLAFGEPGGSAGARVCEVVRPQVAASVTKSALNRLALAKPSVVVRPQGLVSGWRDLLPQAQTVRTFWH